MAGNPFFPLPFWSAAWAPLGWQPVYFRKVAVVCLGGDRCFSLCFSGGWLESVWVATRVFLASCLGLLGWQPVSVPAWYVTWVCFRWGWPPVTFWSCCLGWQPVFFFVFVPSFPQHTTNQSLHSNMTYFSFLSNAFGIVLLCLCLTLLSSRMLLVFLLKAIQAQAFMVLFCYKRCWQKCS